MVYTFRNELSQTGATFMKGTAESLCFVDLGPGANPINIFTTKENLQKIRKTEKNTVV